MRSHHILAVGVLVMGLPAPAVADSHQVVDVQLASTRTTGESGTGDFERPALSRDGRYLTFIGPGSGLVAGDDEARLDVHLRDLATDETARVVEGATGDGWSADVSDDGGSVVFQSDLPRVPADTDDLHDIYIHDVQTENDTLLSASVSGDAVEPSMSADGETAAFRTEDGVWVVDTTTATAEHVEFGDTAPLTPDALSPNGRFLSLVVDGAVVLRDLDDATRTTVATLDEASCPSGFGVSPPSTGVPAVADTGDVVYRDASCRPQLWRRSDGQTGPAYRTSNGEPLRPTFAPSGKPTISADGSVVVFASAAPDLTPAMVNWSDERTSSHRASYVRFETVTEQTQLVAYTVGGRAIGGDHATARGRYEAHFNTYIVNDAPAAVSADGAVVAWASELSGLVTGDTNPGLDVYVRGARTGWQAAPFACGQGTYFSVAEQECHDTMRRMSGADRYATAGLVGALHFQAAADHGYVVSGEAFPDGLAAAVAAGHDDEEVFLVRPDGVPRATTGEILRRYPHAVSLVGGPEAISNDAQDTLNNIYDPVFGLDARDRVSGGDRYETAALLSRRTTPVGAPMYVASGETWPDALTGTVAGIRDEAGLLLVSGEAVPETTRDELARVQPSRITVLGGPVAVADTVVDELEQYTAGDVDRLWGPDRFATAVAISEATFPDPATVDTVHVATGEDFADALAAASGAGIAGWPILLVPSDGPVPDVVRDEIARLGPAGLVLLGGEVALSQAVEDELAALLD